MLKNTKYLITDEDSNLVLHFSFTTIEKNH